MGKKRDFAKEEEELIASVLRDQKERMSKSRSSSNSSNSHSKITESRSFFDKFVDENSYDKQDGIKEKSSTDYGTKEITFESLCKTILPNYSTGKTEEKTTYHYDVKEDGNVSKEPYRSIDNCGRKETASSIYYQKHCNGVESLSLKQDTFKYDTNAQLSDRIVSGNKTTRSVDIYHSHDGVNTKAIFQNGKLVMAKSEEFSHGPNEKVDRKLCTDIHEADKNYQSVNNLKNDDYARFRMPQLDNDKNSNSSVCKEANSFLNEQKEKQQERDVYKEFFPELFTQKHANDMLQQFKDGKADEVREAEEKRYQEEMRERERELERQREADRIREEELERERKLEEKRQREEEREQENESRRCSCSWWYHDRCLKCHDEDYCYKCNDYDTSEHSCATCSSFDSCPGHTKSGDSWYGICTAYDGNPIRDNPSSHTCKAWN